MPNRTARGWRATVLLATCIIAMSPLLRAQPPRVDPVSSVPADPLAETLRSRVDDLRYARERDARGGHIVLGELVARYYEARQFQPAWQVPGRLDALLTSLAELRDDGLDPADYHYESLQSYRLGLRLGKLTADDRADCELLATDAFMLALYHLYVGKVDPRTLSSQWNYETRSIELYDAMQRIAQRLAAGEIHAAFDAVRPQHAWYSRARERLREYRDIAARGGWPAIPDGPTIRPGSSDARSGLARATLACRSCASAC
jgi:murein L,D-transpeptidase YcbB/YkuD